MKPDHELLTVSQMGQADAAAIAAGTPSTQLMQHAGEAVARVVMSRWSQRPVLVLCGPGNNGGDGFVAAVALQQAAWPVRVMLWGDPAALRGDAAWAAQQWQGVGGQIDTWSSEHLSGVGLVIDAVFGAGLSKPLGTDVSSLLAAVAERDVPVVAVDVPSGVWGDSGQADGAVAAHTSVTFFRKKPGHLLMPGKQLCGQVVVADIGINPEVLPALKIDTWVNEPALWLAAWPALDTAGHKYTRGHVAVYGGVRMTGAARLAAWGAARIGAGLTTVAAPEPAWPVYAASLNCVMVHALEGPAGAHWVQAWQHWLQDRRLNAVLVGPGAGAEAHHMASVALKADRAIVLDADALTAWQGHSQDLFDLIQAAPRPVVLTPHEGEFARLFGSKGDAFTSASKLVRARAAARQSGAVVLLKGPDTVVAAPDGRAAILADAPAWLGTAGAGDVLAGMITGLLAQGMPAWEAACAAAWVHAQAGLAFGRGLIADDLPHQIPAVLQRLFPR